MNFWACLRIASGTLRSTERLLMSLGLRRETMPREMASGVRGFFTRLETTP